MPKLRKRVQVLLDPVQFRRLKAIAASRNSSVGSLIREAIRAMSELDLPVSDWERMERESVEPSDLGG